MNNVLSGLCDEDRDEFIDMVVNHELTPKEGQTYMDAYLDYKENLYGVMNL